MRRSASEIIRELEGRIARLERNAKTALGSYEKHPDIAYMLVEALKKNHGIIATKHHLNTISVYGIEFWSGTGDIIDGGLYPDHLMKTIYMKNRYRNQNERMVDWAEKAARAIVKYLKNNRIIG